MRMAAADVAAAAGGKLVGPDVQVEGATIDSRQVNPGQLFVPVVATRDGHDFISDALAAGAAAYLTAREALEGTTAVEVEDTLAALAALGRWARDRLPDRVVGITGSTGKTSTKDLLGAVLAGEGPCAVSQRSHNNELGVPLTLVNAPDDARAAVVEMGARGPGHIRWLCGLAHPVVGVVTNVSLSHTEFLGSADGVAAAKAELAIALPASGVAVLNAEDARVMAMARLTSARVLTFGVEAGDVRAAGVEVDGELRPSFVLETPWGRQPVRLALRGAHQAANAAAAAAAALALDVELAAVAHGLASAAASPWRMEVGRSPGGLLVLNDAYNANPASAEAALRALASTEAHRRVAVLGPMLELGSVSAAEHRRIADLARDLGAEVVVVGTDEYGLESHPDAEAALAALDPLGPDDAVLVKASRAAGLERLAARLLSGEADREQARSPSGGETRPGVGQGPPRSGGGRAGGVPERSDGGPARAKRAW
jgi:UDP-N-acetylmuramoyl-tripeptide--D-alanyl-D-alanine ligase